MLLVLRQLAGLTLITALLLMPLAPRAQEPQVERIDIFDAGIYCAETVQKVLDPSAPGGQRNVVTNVRLLKRTNTIPAQIGTRFGMRYILVGSPKDAFVDLRLMTRLPAPGLQEPSGRTMRANEYAYAAAIGVNGYREYHIEYDWEILPGDWVFELWVGNRKHAEQAFTLVIPEKRTPTPCSPIVGALTSRVN
jgi:hypothetical protein